MIIHGPEPISSGVCTQQFLQFIFIFVFVFTFFLIIYVPSVKYPLYVYLCDLRFGGEPMARWRPIGWAVAVFGGEPLASPSGLRPGVLAALLFSCQLLRPNLTTLVLPSHWEDSVRNDIT
jgi:hypothetical protein